MTGAISQDQKICQFPFCLMKNPLSYRAARPESGRETRERLLREPLARSQSEPRRRLALASGFALFRSFGIQESRVLTLPFFCAIAKGPASILFESLEG